MSDAVIVNIFRFIGLMLVQVLILQNVHIHSHANLYIYPIFILMLPIKTPNWMLLVIAFFLGLSIDIPYNTPGIHAAASVLTAFLRPTLCLIMEPRGGYDLGQSPNKNTFGMSWFFQYSAILMGIHLFAVFCLNAFDMSYLGDIILRTIFSFILSMTLVVLYQYIFNPKK